MKKLLVALLILCMTFTFFGCGSSDNGSSGGGEVIFNVASTIEFDTLNPLTTELALVYDWSELIYDTLTAYDNDYNPVERVAKDWEVSEDGTAWTFYLRDDIYFTDGVQLTSADVQYTYELMADSYLWSLKTYGIESVDCPDDFTVVFNTPDGKGDMLMQGMPILPKHIWEAVDDPYTYEPEEIVGSGPFIYSPERSGPGYVAFVKNENYWGKVPSIDVAVFSTYDTYDTMAQALTIGEVDACYEMDASVESTLAGADGIDAQAFDQICFEYMGYNHSDPLTGDKAIRYAIDYCYDADQAIEMAYYGLGRRAYGPCNNNGYEYIPEDSIKRDFSIEKANQVLDEAGYLDTDGDGIREKDGKPISITLTTASERWSWQSACVNIFITNCKEAGIEIVSETMGKYAMWDKCIDGSDKWQLFMDGWGGDPDPCYMLATFINPEDGGCACANFYSPEYDELYYKAAREADPEIKAQYAQEMQEILYEDCMYTYLEFAAAIQAVNSDKWTGYTSTSRGFFQNDKIADFFTNVTLK